MERSSSNATGHAGRRLGGKRQGYDPRHRPDRRDAVVLDITLPDASGLDVLSQLKSERPTLPVLIMSIHDEEQYALRVLKAGASGYLMKSSIPEELIQAIR